MVGAKKYSRKNYRKGTTKRRGYGKRKRFSKKYKKVSKVSDGRFNGAFTEQMMIKDYYTDKLFSTNGAPGIVDYVYQSSLFDPNSSGVGTFSLYHNEMSAIYQKYRVFAMKMRYKCINMSADPLQICSVMRPEATAIGGLAGEANTWPRSKYIVLGPTGSSRDCGYITHFCKVKDVLGIKDMRDEADTFAYAGASPVLMMYPHLVQASLAGAALNSFIEVHITFYGEWFERNKPDYD